MYDNKIIIKKSSFKDEEFYDLVFCARDIIKITIPSFIRRIEPYAFNKCNKLQTIDFPLDSKLQIIDSYAFYKSAIERISIPSSITEINNYAFGICRQLKVTEIPNNSKICNPENIMPWHHYLEIKVKFKFFKKITKKIELKLNGEVKFNRLFLLKPRNFVFMFLNNSEDLKSQHIRVNDGRFIFELNEDKTASVVDHDSLSGDLIIIPRSIKYNEQEFIVTSIKKDSFKHIYGLTSIQFPLDSEVQIIEENSFDDCFVEEILLPPSIVKLSDGWISSDCGAKKVKMISNNQYYKNYNDESIIGKSDPTSDEYDVLVFANRFIEEITVPSFIKQISPNCFSHNELTKIFITSQVTQIGQKAFSGCFKLTTIQFEPGSQLQRIEDDLFLGSSIKSVTFPPKVKQIGQCAFANCDYIRSVEFTRDSELELIESEVFWNSGIKSVLIPSNTKLAEGWCYLTHCLDEVLLIYKKNTNLIQYDHGLILGKSDTKSDIFDVIHFCPRIN